MQTLSEQRQEAYKDPNLVFCCPLPLYALVEENPRPDEPNYVEVGCMRINGVIGVILCLSPIDAMIERRSYNRDGRRYEVFPYEAVDPRTFIRRHNGWLSLYIVYGYAAHNNKILLSKNGRPAAMLYTLHRAYSPEEIKEHFHLAISDEVTGWLDELHKKARLPDYQSLVSEQARTSMDELDFMASTALQVGDFMEARGHEVTQCALYDPVESEWRFVSQDDLE